MKNHVKPPAEFIARARISDFVRKRTCAKFPLYALSAHDKRKRILFLLIFVGRKAMEIFMEKRPFDLNAEDVTKFGEFVSSFDAWLSFEEQSKRASHLENNTK